MCEGIKIQNISPNLRKSADNLSFKYGDFDNPKIQYIRMNFSSCIPFRVFDIILLSVLLLIVGVRIKSERSGTMKRLMWVLLGIALLAFLSGCATPYPVGAWYVDLKLPVAATADPGPCTKVGTASSQSILALVAIGDSSIDTAAKNGGITTIHHVDWEAKNILGIIGNYKVTVYGK